jgi:hypothetical protein
VKNISKILIVTALVAGASSANAWWNGPFNSNGFGNGSFNMSFSAHANGNAWGRHYSHTGPYTYYPHQGPAVIPAPTEEQQAALQKQREAFAEQEAVAYMQAREAREKFMEQHAARFESPADLSHEEMQAEREKIRAQMQKQREAVKARHAAMRKAAEERRQQRNI